MIKNILKNFSDFDKKMLLAAAFSLLIFSYLIYDDSLINGFTKRTGKTVGVIASSSNDVRQKSNTEFKWNSTSNKRQVYLGDSVFTGEGSSAEIQLGDNSKVDIKPNSLVVFNQTGDQVSVGLSFGSLSGKLNGKLKIEGLNIEISGDNAEFNLGKNSNGEIEITALKGQIKTANGIITGKQILNSKEVQVPTLPAPSIVTPAQNAILKFKPEDTNGFEFTWTHQRKKGFYEFQISPTPDFKNPVYTKKISALRVIPSNVLSKGSYFARVREIIKGSKKNNEQAWSQVLQFTVEPEIINPRLAAPQILKNTSPLLVEKQETQRISWQPIEGAKKYKVEISKTADFKEVKKLETSSNLVQLNEKAEGLVYLRISAIDEKNILGDYAVSELQITTLRPKPENIGLTKPKSLTYSVDINQQDQVKLDWTPIAQIKTFKLEIAKSATFNNPIVVNTNETFYNLKTTEPGFQFVRISGQYDKDTIGRPSSIIKIHSFLSKPVLSKIPEQKYIPDNEDDFGDKTPFEVKWSENKLASKYLVQFSRNSDFSELKQIETKTPYLKLNVPKTGEYFVRVQSLNSQGKSASEFSDPGVITLTRLKPLYPPTIQDPQAQTTLFYQSEKEMPILTSWSGVENAALYTLEASSYPDFSKIILRKTTPGTKLFIKEKMPSGSVYWRVRAENEQKKSDWSKAQPVFVLFGRPDKINQEQRLPAGFSRPLNVLEKKKLNQLTPVDNTLPEQGVSDE